MSFDVFGMCNPLYDIQAELSDALLAKTGYAKGGMHLIEHGDQEALIAAVRRYVVNEESGGSGANTMIGVAMLGGAACYTGKLANDERGALYAGKLRDKGVVLCAPAGTGTTGVCVVLVTPDAERTLCTYLGICRALGPSDIDENALKSSKYLYVTGYLWDTESQKAAVSKAMEIARSNGVKVAMSLSDTFCVMRHKSDFREIASDYVDLLIGNSDEMEALTDTANPEDALLATVTLCEGATITMGARGALLRSGANVHEVNGYKVHAVDTTGAGDTYAAGILYGLTAGISIEQTGKIACYLAAQVVSKLGPRLDKIDREVISGL